MDSISALTHSLPPSVEQALTDCGDPFETTEVDLAYRSLDRLVARPQAPGEDGADTYDGVRMILRLMAEAQAWRKDVASDALKTMAAAVARDRAQREKK